MNALITNIADQRREELRKQAEGHRRSGRRRRQRRSARPAPALAQELSIHRLGDADRNALERLAGLDSAETPRGEVLGAELDGRLIAAVALETGDLVADPFTPTDQARSLLELRIAQLSRSHGARHAIRRHGFHLRAAQRRG
jgi:hypothetical protein